MLVMPQDQRTIVAIVFLLAGFCLFASWRQGLFNTAGSPLKKLPAETAARMMGVGFVVFGLWWFAAMAIASLPLAATFGISSQHAELLAIISANFSALFIVIAASVYLELPILNRASPPPPMIDRFRWAFICLLMTFPVVMATAVISRHVFIALNLHPPDGHELIQTAKSGDRLVVALVVISVAIAAPLFEELFFRGLLQRALLGLSQSPWIAITLSSLVFALVHQWSLQPAIFVLSLSIGLLYQRTGSLLCVILVHAAFNTINLSLSLFASSPPQ